MSQRLLLTGAAGQIGSFLRPRLAQPGRILRLLDLAPLPAAAPGEAVETLHADITDPAAMREACRGVDAVIHLAAISHEAEWPEILHTNIDGTYHVLDGARSAGVPRVILASSNHAVGFHPLSGEVIPDYLLPRPTHSTASARPLTKPSAVSTTTATAWTSSASVSAAAR